MFLLDTMRDVKDKQRKIGIGWMVVFDTNALRQSSHYFVVKMFSVCDVCFEVTLLMY